MEKNLEEEYYYDINSFEIINKEVDDNTEYNYKSSINSELKNSYVMADYSSNNTSSNDISGINNQEDFMQCDNESNCILHELKEKYFNNTKYTQKIKNKIKEIFDCFSFDKIICFEKLKILTFEGIPDETPELRSLIWKLLFNYLPLDNIKNWSSYLDEKKKEYDTIKFQIFGNTNKNDDTTSSSVNEGDKKIKDEIAKDVKRTRASMHFFIAPCIQDDKETNSQVLQRILFIFAKTHPEINYIQGMNELVATIYYCYFKGITSNQNTLEADVYFSFTNFMCSIKEIYIKENDDNISGIKHRINRIGLLLKFKDFELFKYLAEQKVEVQFFAFRWLILFFTQEFNMPDTIRLWDSILTQEDKFKFATFLSLTLIVNNRKVLLSKDFSAIMWTMQNISLLDLDPERIISDALDIQNSLSDLYNYI